MSKTLKIDIYPADTFEPTLKNVVALMTKAGWSITDSSGRISIWNDAADEWEYYTGTADDFVNSYRTCLFYMHGNDRQIVTISVDGSRSFRIYPEADIKKVVYNGKEYFDLNWYYEHFIVCFNKEKSIVERVVFEEY